MSTKKEVVTDEILESQFGAAMFGDENEASGAIAARVEYSAACIAAAEAAFKDVSKRNGVACDTIVTLEDLRLSEIAYDAPEFNKESMIGLYASEVFGGTHPLSDKPRIIRMVAKFKQANHPQGNEVFVSTNLDYNPWQWPAIFTNRRAHMAQMSNKDTYAANMAAADKGVKDGKKIILNHEGIFNSTYGMASLLNSLIRSAASKKPAAGVVIPRFIMAEEVKTILKEYTPDMASLGIINAKGYAALMVGTKACFLLKDEFADMGVFDADINAYRLDIVVGEHNIYAGPNAKCDYHKPEEWCAWIAHNNLYFQLVMNFYQKHEALIKEGALYMLIGYNSREYPEVGAIRMTASCEQSATQPVFEPVITKNGKIMPTQLRYRFSANNRGYNPKHIWPIFYPAPKAPAANAAPNPNMVAAPANGGTANPADYMQSFNTASGI